MKFWNYAIITVGLALIFELAGMPVATGLLTYLGITTSGLSIQSAAMWVFIFGGAGILIGIGAAILIGTLTRSPPENFLILPFIVTVGTLFIMPLIGIELYARTNFPGWIHYITLFLIALLSIGLVISLIDYFRGNVD